MRWKRRARSSNSRRHSSGSSSSYIAGPADSRDAVGPFFARSRARRLASRMSARSTITSMKMSLAPRARSFASVSDAHLRRSLDVPDHFSLKHAKVSLAKRIATLPESTFFRRRSLGWTSSSSSPCAARLSASCTSADPSRTTTGRTSGDGGLELLAGADLPLPARGTVMLRSAADDVAFMKAFISSNMNMALWSEPGGPPARSITSFTSKSFTSAPWKKERYLERRWAMKGLPRSGSPMRQRTWRTPSRPATAAIGGGTAVGSGLSLVALSRWLCDCT
mmetsp:Transcript_45304/g.150170  ORF Transcript_45304/g.150170 Transcript_45304/m.150170 type:complete len:279 (-) Transcript_45304:113-949(-)